MASEPLSLRINISNITKDSVVVWHKSTAGPILVVTIHIITNKTITTTITVNIKTSKLRESTT